MDVATDQEVDGSEFGRAIEAKILDLLTQRGPGKSICPSEVARALRPGPRSEARHHGEPAADWRALMGPVREAADRLVATGEIVATQRGEIVDLSTVRGPIRLVRRIEHCATE